MSTPTTELNPPSTEKTLSQPIKAFINRIIILAAHANIEGGEGQRQTAKNNGDITENTTEEKLFAAYYGDASSGTTSFLDDFCAMRGPVFQKFIEKGYAYEKKEDGGHTAKIFLNLELLLRCPNACLALTDSVRKRLGAKTLNNPSVRSGPRNLMIWKRNNLKEVKPLQDLVRKFCNGSGDEEIPSGKNFEDLQNYVWNEMWKRKESSSKKNQKKNNENGDDSDEFDEEEGAINQDDSTNNSNEDEAMPIVYNCKWYPPGWHCFFVYVCKHSRICDDYLHIFQFSGVQLDNSKAISRAESRKIDLKSKQKKRKFEAGSPVKKRGLTIDERQTSIALRLKASKDNREEIGNEIESRIVNLASMRQHQGMLYNMVMGMCKDDMGSISSHTLYKQANDMTEQISMESSAIDKLRLELTDLKKNDQVRDTALKELEAITSSTSARTPTLPRTPIRKLKGPSPSIQSPISEITGADGDQVVVEVDGDANEQNNEESSEDEATFMTGKDNSEDKSI